MKKLLLGCMTIGVLGLTACGGQQLAGMIGREVSVDGSTGEVLESAENAGETVQGDVESGGADVELPDAGTPEEIGTAEKEGSSITENDTPQRKEDAAKTKVTAEGPYGSFTIALPEGWEYEVCPAGDERLMGGDYGIHFYPAGISDGFIELSYHSMFGVCGTGLLEETYTLSGDSAVIGYYDGSKYWSFIIYQGKNEKLVALASETDHWWEEYGAEAMTILDTIEYDKENQSGAIGFSADDSFSDKHMLSVEAVDITPTKATLKFIQFDPMVTAELSFGENFKLQKKDGDHWQEVPVVIEGEYAFNDIAYNIQMNDTTRYEYDWEWLYGTLEPGEYRIETTIVAQSGGVNETYQLYAYFILR